MIKLCSILKNRIVDSDVNQLIMKRMLLIFLLSILLNSINKTVVFAQDNMLCQGAYWTEDEAAAIMKKWASEWTTRADWEKRAEIIRHGIIAGMKFDQMPKVENNFNPIIHSTREMDGYIVENIAFESFPGFYITGNLYRPLKPDKKCPAILSSHGHGPDGRMSKDAQIRNAAFARMGAVVFAYDMIGYNDSKQVTHKMSVGLIASDFQQQKGYRLLSVAARCGC